MRVVELFKAILIEGRVKGIEILGIQLIRRKAHTLAETLKMDYLPCAQEFDRVADVGIVDKPQDIVVRLSRLLLRRKILGKVAYSVARALDISGSERHSRGRGGVNTGGVVNEICVEARALYLILGEISRELIDYRADHFEMPKFLGPYIRQQSFQLVKRHCKALAEVAQRSAELAVGAAVLLLDITNRRFMLYFFSIAQGGDYFKH